MTDVQPAPGPGNVPPPDERVFHEHEHELEEYAGGYIQAWVGRIPYWLQVVYAILFFWALYYGYTYWGGLGPGRPYW